MTLPTFIVIGAAKAGTTSLYRYLAQHPEIFMPTLKETNFFALEGRKLDFRGPGDKEASKHSITDLASYRQLYAGGRGLKVKGDCSPLYLFAPNAARNIRAHVPHAKLIAMLRHPVDRAYSQFLDQYNRGYLWTVRSHRVTANAFTDALAKEEHRMAANWWPFWFYKSMGMYHQQLRRYFDVFPRDQIRVYLYEDLVSDPATLLSDLFSFLEVNQTFMPNVREKHNVSGVPKSRMLTTLIGLGEWTRRLIPFGSVPSALSQVRQRLSEYNTAPPPPLEPELRRKLVNQFGADLRRLETLIGRDLSAWHRERPSPDLQACWQTETVAGEQQPMSVRSGML